MRQKYVNKIVIKAIDDFKERVQTPKAPTVEKYIRDDGTIYTDKRYELFGSIEETKIILGYITEKGLDPWERKTIEANKIVALLENTTWDDVCSATPSG